MNLKKIQKAFLWKNYTSKIKHETVSIEKLFCTGKKILP